MSGATTPSALAPLVVTPGDPNGIGPEVAVRALRVTGADAVLLGDVAALLRVAPELPVVDEWPARGASGVCVLAPPPGDEPVEVRALREAVRRCLSGEARALVTGPIHKARLAAKGFHHHGHTEFLGELCGVEHPVMAFVGGDVRVALVTVHIPLSAVPAAVTYASVLHTIRAAAHALQNDLGIPNPRITVCGLNPHAGDGGVLGSEEETVIGPACESARAAGIDARGPLSAETAFMDPAGSDLIVAMYHDQGLVPLKRVDFGRSVNWTLGLPIIRTSVDHGTADDLVGTGRARADSMVEAIRLALQLSQR